MLRREELSEDVINRYQKFAKTIVSKHTYLDDDNYINVCENNQSCWRTSLHVGEDYLINRLNYSWKKIPHDRLLFDTILENLLIGDYDFHRSDAYTIYYLFVFYEIYEKYYSPLSPDYINETTNKKTHHLTKEDNEFFYRTYKEMGVDKEWAENDLYEIKGWINGLPPTIILYRLLYVDDENNINREELGDHYTPVKKELLYNHNNKGSIYGGHWGHPILLTVEVVKDQINVFTTIHNNILYPHEQEITLKDGGRGVKILKVERL